MYKDLKKFVQSQTFRGITIGVFIAVIALLIFQVGTFVGYRKAAFSYHFGDNYYRAFGDRGSRPLNVAFRRGLIGAHGTVGNIVSVDLPTFIVADKNNVEKVVLIKKDTVLRRFDGTMTSDDLTVDDFAVVLGSPNDDSQIEATLIRILPPPPENGEVRLRIRK